MSVYTSTTCTLHSYDNDFYMSFSIAGDSPIAAGAKILNLNYGTTTKTLLDSTNGQLSGATSWNKGAGKCGINTWSVGATFDISGKICGSASTPEGGPGITHYMVLQPTNPAAFLVTSEVSTMDTLPTGFNGEIYVKQ